MTARTCSVVVFPEVSRMMLGGGPSRVTSSAKSRSFVISAVAASFAAAKIARSSAREADVSDLNASLSELARDPARERWRQMIVEPDRHSAAMSG